ncbi:MAG: asparagine--tRNA ligase [Planctomycetota bacterium]
MTQQEFRGLRAVPIHRLHEHVGEEVLVQGWLYNLRSKGKLHFLQVRDGTGIVQVVAARGSVPDASFEVAGALSQEASLRVTGKVVADQRAPSGVELQPSWIERVSDRAGYPISKKEHGVGFLMEHRHLWLRSRRPTAILRIRDEVIKAMRDFFYERDFACVDSPMFTPNACEGTTTLFQLDYFGEKAYLTQSGQLYAEATAMALGKVYCFGPTFRAEKSKTRRHLTEFWMIEPEAAFYDLEDVMALAEDLVSHVVTRVLERRRQELEVLERDVSKLEPATATPYPRLRYDEAVELLRGCEDVAFVPGEDFGAPHETLIGSAFDRPVMVHRYPRKIKAFYMKVDPEDPDLALCVDVIAPEGHGEIIGGSEREDDLEILRQRVREHDLPEDAFRWYVDLRRFGSVPHGGFGLGLERTVSWITGVEHLRECIAFPRMLYKIYP